MSIACRNGIPRLVGWLHRVSPFVRLKPPRGVPARPRSCFRSLRILSDGLPLAPEREADDLADVGASSILIIDFRHRAQAEICARCARPWPKEMFSPGIS